MNDERTTPIELFTVCDVLFGPFELDAASTPANKLAPRRCEDGLADSWATKTWCNPPYSRGSMELWLSKGRREAAAGNSSCFLIQSSTGDRWFKQHVVDAGAKVVFLVGRVAFGNGKGEGRDVSMFGSCLVLFGPAYSEVENVSWLDWKGYL